MAFNPSGIWLLAEKVAPIQDPTIAHPQIRKFLELTRKAADLPLHLPINDSIEKFSEAATMDPAAETEDNWDVMLNEELTRHATPAMATVPLQNSILRRLRNRSRRCKTPPMLNPRSENFLN